MKIKRLFFICFAILLSHQTICHAKSSKSASIIWPIFFGGGTFFFTPDSVDQHYPGYTFSGGLTLYVDERNINIMDKMNLFFFIDALYSYRAYDGFPQEVHYRIEENSADLAVGVGSKGFYAGCYIQVPTNTMIRVSEWTMEDFDGLSRNPSISLMGGLRVAGRHLGIDARILLGQGPGQFLRKSFGEDHWLGQITLGIMARI